MPILFEEGSLILPCMHVNQYCRFKPFVIQMQPRPQIDGRRCDVSVGPTRAALPSGIR
jgi:hypothetical protein